MQKWRWMSLPWTQVVSANKNDTTIIFAKFILKFIAIVPIVWKISCEKTESTVVCICQHTHRPVTDEMCAERVFICSASASANSTESLWAKKRRREAEKLIDCICLQNTRASDAVRSVYQQIEWSARAHTYRWPRTVGNNVKCESFFEWWKVYVTFRHMRYYYFYRFAANIKFNKMNILVQFFCTGVVRERTIKPSQIFSIQFVLNIK